MSDELDPTLLRLFKERRESLPDEEFLVTLLGRIQQRQRVAAVRLAAIIAAALLCMVWLVPGLLRATAAIVQSIGARTDTYASLPLSPMGWAVSMLVGLAVILRTMPRRR
jgi:uncharacterized protein with PQ loop repeat